LLEVKGSRVTIEHVSKRFDNGFIALDDINITIEPGEFFSLLGPSGCGKTTLLRIIAGFEYPDEGAVLFDGTNVVSLPPDKRHSNTVFQTYALFPHLSVYENVAFPLRLKKVPKETIDEKVKHYIHLVQLDQHIHKKPNQLSGGQKQRVAIARALINEPKVLLLDEPLSALDAKLRANLLIDLDNLHDKIGITFIYVTHDQSEALSVSDHIAVMNAGHVLQVGTPFEIYESPATQFVAQFIGETNLFEAQVVDCVPHQTPGKDPDYMVTCSVPALGHQAPLASDTEATASLDSVTERAIMKTVDRLTDGITTIIIAHRLSTIVDCDKIFVFEAGKLVESGTHKTLLKKTGAYKTLWNAQQHSFTKGMCTDEMCPVL